ncbi:MAG: OmpA family protein [Saprospiraceae bacterium]|nr:OmpA family protein [Saprospiraceae bacterium]
MATRLTPFSRLLIVVGILAGVVFGGKYLFEHSSLKDKFSDSNKKGGSTSEGKALPIDDDVLNVQVFTFGNAAPGLYFNNGTEPNENSRFYKDYNLKVKFHVIDDFDASRQAFKGDKVQLFNNETSAMATEMQGLAPFNPQVVMQLDWSRGADAVVAKRSIQSINDLKGKKIAVAPSTPSQTLLLFMLEAANLKPSDIQMVEVPTTADAETAFKSGKVDAAVVWDAQSSLREVPGSKVLQSTVTASNIIADVFMGKKEWINANKDKLRKFYDGWMTAVAEINSDPAAKDKAAQIMASNLQLSKNDALGMIDALRLTNHGDNINFFGLNPDYKGITGEQLYTKMGDKYQSLGLAPANRPNWRALSNSYAVSNSTLSPTGVNAGEGNAKFTPATSAQKSAPAVATKTISITFPTGSYTLDGNAKSLIDLQFADVAKGFGNARVRIEGNTDNVGNKLKNIELSRKRAEAVAHYLEQTYDMDANRFIIIGNGQDKPVPGCESNATAECRAKNRRTEFQLVGE